MAALLPDAQGGSQDNNVWSFELVLADVDGGHAVGGKAPWASWDRMANNWPVCCPRNPDTRCGDFSGTLPLRRVERLVWSDGQAFVGTNGWSTGTSRARRGRAGSPGEQATAELHCGLVPGYGPDRARGIVPEEQARGRCGLSRRTARTNACSTPTQVSRVRAVLRRTESMCHPECRGLDKSPLGTTMSVIRWAMRYGGRADEELKGTPTQRVSTLDLGPLEPRGHRQRASGRRNAAMNQSVMKVSWRSRC
jgi:hypothetical protein